MAARGADRDPAVTGPGGAVSYAQLRSAVATFAGHCRPGERVAVCSDDPLQVIVGVLGAHRADATAVVVDPAWPVDSRERALRLARAGEAVHDGLCWVGFTSGSAGTPRPIGRRADSWATSFPLISERTGILAGHRVLVGGSLASSLFLFGALHALWAGAHVVAPGRWEPGRLPEVDVTHCVPAMLADLVQTRRLPQVAVCGGAALPEPLRCAARLQGVRVHEYYGATELSFVAWRDDHDRLLPFPGVEVQLRDGEIWARSRYLSAGYADPTVTGPLRWDHDGFATVGDRGALGPSGELSVLGRADGTILTGGAPVLPEDVERVLAEVPGVRDVVVVGLAHPRLGAVVAAVLEPVSGHRPTLPVLRDAVRGTLAAPQRPRRWFLVDRLPRTGAGKVARGATATALGDGTLSTRELR